MEEHRLERLITVGRSLVSELDIESLLEQILEAARELTGARYAALGILAEDRQHLERFVTSGIDESTHATIGDLPRGRGVLGVLIREPRPLRLRDVSAHPQSYGFPLGHPPMSSFLGVPVIVRGEAWGNLYLTEKASGDFTQEDEDAAIVLADWASVAISNARLYRDVAARKDELERAVRVLETTTEISRALGGETELDRILELVAKRARALTNARTAVIALVDGDEIVVVQAAGQVSAEVIGQRMSIDDSVFGYVVLSRRPERLADVRARVTFRLAGHATAETGLIVPLAFRNRALGVVAVFDHTGDAAEFTPDDERLLLAFAASAATAVATAQDVAEDSLRRTLRASEDERRRWARELHDQTLQDLAALRVFLSAARRTDDAAELQGAMTDAVEQLARGIDDLRAIITDLRPAALDDLGLGPALQGLVERVGAHAGIPIALEIDLDYEGGRAPSRLHAEVEATAFRLTQEALTNVVKHAEASSVEVQVVEDENGVRVRVADDGRGFAREDRSEGFGLIGMRERVALLGGKLRITSELGAGTTVTALLPTKTPAAHRTEREPPSAASPTG